MLGIFGPLGLIAILLPLSAGAILCFTGLHWAVSTHLGSRQAADFGNDLHFSAGAFFSATSPATPTGGAGKRLQIMEAANGLGFLAIAIGYLSALYEPFSRRETAVSRLDPRAGSPPSPGRLLERSGQRGGWPEFDQYLLEWETWTADLMETHLAARRLNRGGRADPPDRAPGAGGPRPHGQRSPARARPRAPVARAPEHGGPGRASPAPGGQRVALRGRRGRVRRASCEAALEL
jgi:hypothetical protein